MIDNTHFKIDVLGYIRTCFPEKFGIPRQPLLATNARAELILRPPYNQIACVDGLEKSSHVWLTFVFHQHIKQGWKAKVRPPRLGGNKKCGVFASRSSFRPNFLGQSAVKLDEVDIRNNEVKLCLSGIDLVDGTPIVDIKPYISYSDAIPNAFNSLAEDFPECCDVVFLENALCFCEDYSGAVNLECLIKDVLQQDPRPAYHHIDSTRLYKMKLLDVDITWCCKELESRKIIEVISIEQL